MTIEYVDDKRHVEEIKDDLLLAKAQYNTRILNLVAQIIRAADAFLVMPEATCDTRRVRTAVFYKSAEAVFMR
jgi:hypothetical protein